ncbi:acyl carrier protein [Parafilimonas sp.]|uniref:acyl carrier protein n=1 Tax=Parafilimonas sp. TaxID=1969739 RepID=UPI0039E323BE
MTREDILEELKKVLAYYTPDKEMLNSITPETDFVNDLKINSANLVDIIIEAEEKYDIEIDMDAAERIRDVGSCVDVIQEKINEKK